jgi:hypothetical protein
MIKFFRSIFVSASFVALCVGGILSYATPVAAAGLIPSPTGKCPEDYASPVSKMTPLGESCKDGDRDYSLGDVKSVLVRIGNFMLGVSGAIALVIFTLGGFYWVMSAGSSKMVQKGKDLMKSGVIGLVILFSAYTVVAFAVKLFAGDEGAKYLPKVGGVSGMDVGSSGGGSASGVISKPMAGVAASDQCVAIGGNCPASGTCSGTVISGACSGALKCCLTVTNGSKTEKCGKLGGTCQDNKGACTGPYVSGLCSGAASVQCCFPKK